MSTQNFGFSNIYLKVAAVSLALCVVTLGAVLFAPHLLGSGAVRWPIFFGFAGIVLYTMGRIVKIIRDRT